MGANCDNEGGNKKIFSCCFEFDVRLYGLIKKLDSNWTQIVKTTNIQDMKNMG